MIRVGVAGFGNIDSRHALALYDGAIAGARLSAVCNREGERLDSARDKFTDDVKIFDSYERMISSGDIDGVIIATPHYSHTDMALEAIKRGLHVLVEKPAGVCTKEVRIMNDAAEQSGCVFSIMLNQRTIPLYRKLKSMFQSGGLGELKRTNWVITDWYRTDSYYRSRDWRGSWKGDGGGVLLNQAPHQLDLWQWIFGMPVRVRAFCGFGKYHAIDVEDDITAYVEYPNGATGVFIASTGEAPGTNRLEAAGEMGKVVVEGGELTFYELEQNEREFNRSFSGSFGNPGCKAVEITADGEETGCDGIIRNWIGAIEGGEELIAPGRDGLNSLALANAMVLSSWTDDWVEIPFDDEQYYDLLQKRING